ncbi:type II secretion system F family protein [Bacillus sp. N9]
MSAWIITLLPVGLGFYMATVSKGYFQPMLGHPIGIMLIVIAGLSIIIGWFFIQKIIRIEV